MIVNTGWLLDYLSPKIPLEDLLAALPRVGLDVEAAHVLARELAPVRVGFVRAKKPLEGTTDKFVLDVEVAKDDIRQIICASVHPIEVGWGVPVALTGTELRQAGSPAERPAADTCEIHRRRVVGTCPDHGNESSAESG